MKKTLTKDDVNHIADLARLSLTKEELEKITPQLKETLDCVDNLEEIDTSHIDSYYSSSRKMNVCFNDGEKNRRLLTQDEAVFNSTRKKNGFFIVKKVM